MSANAPVKQGAQKTVDWVMLYTSGVSLVGTVILVTALLNLPEDWVGVLVFSLMVVVAEIASVELFHTSRSSSVSVSMIVSLAAVIYFGPLTGVLIQLSVVVANSISTAMTGRNAKSKNRVPWLRRAAFNGGMFAISTAASGYVYILTGGQVGDVMHVSNILPIFLASTADIIVNIGLLIGVISLQSGEHPLTIWKQDFQWAAQIGLLAEAIGGAALAMAYQMEKVIGALVFFLPVLSIELSFRIYANNMRSYVDSLENLNNELNDINIDLLKMLGAVIDAYDVFTYGHSTQVAVYAGALAEQMGLPQPEQEKIVRAALVHDIGKIGISDTIIRKPGELNEDERNLICRHPGIAAEILGRIKGFKELVPLVQYHHERYDGSGYPSGLQGEGIPPGARVITLADSLDAMLSDRAYRPSRTLEEVIADVKSNSGTQFNPQVVKAFLQLVETKESGFFVNSAKPVDRSVMLTTLGNQHKRACTVPEEKRS